VVFEKNAEEADQPTDYNLVKVHCVPFASALLAVNETSIDFFRLNAGGQELDILKTIPWNDIHIQVRLTLFEIL
jgi:hypothetical protein